MADIDRELNHQVAAARLNSLLERGAPVSIHGGALDAAWVRRALAAVALTMAGAAAAAPVQVANSLHSKDISAHLAPVQVVIAGKAFEAPHPMERVRLCKEIASESRLNAHGFDWRDLYAIVQAETGWAARDGIGLNGKASYGLAQMEEATAKSLGIDPNDPRQSIEGVAKLIKEAGAWARVKGIQDKRTALSVYYNLSTKARNAWDGVSIDSLPVPTQHHITNMRLGHKQATSLAPRYEKFAIAARADLKRQQSIRADLEQQRAHLAQLPVMGFESAGDLTEARSRVSQILAARATDSPGGAAAVVASGGSGSMSVRLRMQGFPGGDLRPSEDMARRAANQVRRELEAQGAGTLADSLRFLGQSASDAIASARQKLFSQPTVTAKNSFMKEFPALARAVGAFGGADIVASRSAQQLVDGQPDGRVRERSMAANNRLAQDPETRLVKDATVAAVVSDVLREQQMKLAEALQRLASHATSSSVQYALNEQGRMVAAAANRPGARMVHS